MSWTREAAGPFADFAEMAFEHYASVLDSITDQLLFRGVYVHARKMAGLALLSALRQHRVENALNLRQVLEATSLLGYFAALQTIPEAWAQENAEPGSLFKADDDIKRKAYAWMQEHHPDLNGDILFYKGRFNRSTSHATLMATAYVFDYRETTPLPDQRFFDVPDPKETRAALLTTGQVIGLSLVMIQRAALAFPGITVRPDLESILDKLKHDAVRLRAKLIVDFDGDATIA